MVRSGSWSKRHKGVINNINLALPKQPNPLPPPSLAHCQSAQAAPDAQDAQEPPVQQPAPGPVLPTNAPLNPVPIHTDLLGLDSLDFTAGAKLVVWNFVFSLFGKILIKHRFAMFAGRVQAIVFQIEGRGNQGSAVACGSAVGCGSAVPCSPAVQCSPAVPASGISADPCDPVASDSTPGRGGV